MTDNAKPDVEATAAPAADARKDCSSRDGYGPRCRRRGGRKVLVLLAIVGSFFAGGVMLSHLHAEGYRGFGPEAGQTYGGWGEDGSYGPHRFHHGPMGFGPHGGPEVGGPEAMGPGGPFGPPPADPAARLDFARYGLDMALTRVDATAEQKTKVLAIFDDNAKALKSLPLKAFTTRQELISLLTAPTIDRAKLEALRAERIADADAASKALVKSVADIGDILSAEQRVKLAMLLEHVPH